MTPKNKLIKRIVINPNQMVVCKDKAHLNALRNEIADTIGIDQECITFTYVEVDKTVKK